MKFFTQVNIGTLPVQVSLHDKVMVLGSCFADNVGGRMKAAGFDVCVNPFGTLYNPASILNSVARMESGIPFTNEDCVPMGAGAGLVCSYAHHTSFARSTEAEFLENANEKLQEASSFWHSCNKVIITLGTAWVWKAKCLISDNKTKKYKSLTNLLTTEIASFDVVSNCLKRPSGEFVREMLSVEQIKAILDDLKASFPSKEFIFTVSPIRHLSDGAHSNTLSKASLHLAIGDSCYFPAFELLNDELRDYRFYAEDLVHPSPAAIEFVWEKFLEAAVPVREWDKIRENEKAARFAAHRQFR